MIRTIKIYGCLSYRYEAWSYIIHYDILINPYYQNISNIGDMVIYHTL